MEVGGELERICADLNAAIEQARSEGYRLDIIYPADDPHEAMLSGPGGTLRLTSSPGAPRPTVDLPLFIPEFVLTHAADDGGAGRAGMLYRDLISSRLGERYIASHIRIADGGPVADWVHYHRLTFQIIAVRKGWVRVVYEDQGDPFVMNEGDLVLQPPGIRHRVLESSAGLEVVEISCPALHETCADHDMILPNGRIDEGRDFGGQRFLRHVAAAAPWQAFREAEARETGLRDATGGLADARVLRRRTAHDVGFAPHDGELVFGFVIDGRAILDRGGEQRIGPADSFVIPPDERWCLRDMSEDFRMLHVTTARFGPSKSA